MAEPGETGRTSINAHGVSWREDSLGRQPELYHPEEWRRASEIPVNAFRQIYLWPLALRADAIDDDRNDGMRRAIAGILKELCGDPAWQAVPNLADHLPVGDVGATAAERAHRFAEFVYFHDFIQASLFDKGPTGPQRAINLFRRLGSLDAEVWIGGRRFCFSLDRVNLYVFSSGAVMLAVEADFGKKPSVGDATGSTRPMSLADVEDFTDRFRRAYPPYFAASEDGSRLDPGLVADSIEIIDRESKNLFSSAQEYRQLLDFQEVDRRLERYNAPPLFAHWLAFVAPLAVVGTEAAEKGRLKKRPIFRQIVDERLPLMSFVALDPTSADGTDQGALRAVQRGDWARLCSCDSAGISNMPYSAPFLADFETQCCYDRFFPHESSPSGTTRFLFSGYHFAVVGAGDFFEETLLHHFRRHYFQMGLAVHMEIASLLATSSRITDAVRRFQTQTGRRSQKKFERRMQLVERDFLQYVHLFHFTGMSNQTQPTEMLALWRERLGLPALFEDVRTEIDTANQFLLAADQAEQAEAASRLNLLATLGIVLGLVFAALGMNILVGAAALTDAAHWRGFGVVLSLFSGAAMLVAAALGGLRSDSRALWLLALLLVFGLAAAVGAGRLAVLLSAQFGS